MAWVFKSNIWNAGKVQYDSTRHSAILLFGGFPRKNLMRFMGIDRFFTVNFKLKLDQSSLMSRNLTVD